MRRRPPAQCPFLRAGRLASILSSPTAAAFGLSALLSLAAPASAEVVDTTPEGFQVKATISATSSPDRVYKVLTDEIGKWWNPAHTYSKSSGNLRLEDRPGGCLCEKLSNGGGVEHLVVTYVEPGKALRLRGALGPLQEMGVTGSLTFLLEPAGSGTTVTLTYAIGGYFPGGFEKIAPPVDRVMTDQLERLGRYADTGRPEAAGTGR